MVMPLTVLPSTDFGARFNYFERHLPSVGFYAPIAGAPFPGSGSPGIDRHIEL
jgi:hypothetical protein